MTEGWLVRPATVEDLDAVYDLAGRPARASPTFPMTATPCVCAWSAASGLSRQI